MRLTWHAADGERVAAGAGAVRDRRPGARGTDRRAHRAQLPAAAVGHRHRGARATWMRSPAPRCRILDTRKTLPGPAHARRSTPCAAAARDNHRHGPLRQVLIKENHIAAAGSIAAAVAAARPATPGVRVRSRWKSSRSQELEQAFAAGADIIMLDEFSPERHARCGGAASARSGAPVKLEASGGVSLESGARDRRRPASTTSRSARITKHVRAVDLSMRLEFGGG